MKKSARAGGSKRESLREANRIHCREARARKRMEEQMLHEEVHVLELCRSMVESGPDMFSVHGLSATAPFSFICESFCEWLQIEPEDVLKQPLFSIVDPRDTYALNDAVLQVLARGSGHPDSAGSGPDTASMQQQQQQPQQLSAPIAESGFNGCLISVRVNRFGRPRFVEMSITIGRQGLIIVTRLCTS